MRHVVQGMTIDNGGSGVRVIKDGGVWERDAIIMPNNFVEIQEKDFRVKDVADPTMLCRFREAPKEEYLGILANGLTGAAFNNTAIMITNQETKTGTLEYYKQFLFTVAKQLMKEHEATEKKTVPVKRGLFKKTEYVDYADIMYHPVIITLLPIKEHSGVKDCAQILRQNLKGTYTVEFPLLPGSPIIRFTLDPRFIGVLPEGGIAIRSISSQIQDKDITCIVDMGHVSTDIAIFEGTSLKGKVKSSGFAGSVLVGDVKAALEEHGYRLNNEQVEQVLETNQARRGAVYEDVTEIIQECKVAFVHNYLKKEILECLMMNAINVKQVQNLLCIGAPMRDSGRGTIQRTIVEACQMYDARQLRVDEDTRYVNIRAAMPFVSRLAENARVTIESEYPEEE